MMIMKRLLFLVSVCSLCMVGNSQNYQPEKHAVVKSDRGDGRLLSTYAIVHEMLKDTHPQYAYRSGMSAQEFTQWQVLASYLGDKIKSATSNDFEIALF